MAGRAARRRDRVAAAEGGASAPAASRSVSSCPGSIAREPNSAGTPKSAPTTARCTVSGTSRPAAADPISRR